MNYKPNTPETSFGMSNDAPNEERWVIAKPGEDLGEWVESEYNKGRRFVSRQEAERSILLSQDIPNLFKSQLRAKRITDLTS